MHHAADQPTTTPEHPDAPPVSEQLWHDVHDRLTAFVARRIDEPADVADLVQTVFLRVHQHAEHLDDEARLLPWLFQVTRNAIADYYRAPARRREVASSEETNSAMATEEINDDATAVSDLAHCVRPMVEQLPPTYRDAITEVEFNGLSQTELAEQLGISVSGMKSRVQRGRAMLRDTLLACCTVSQSATGGVMDYHRRTTSPCAPNDCGDATQTACFGPAQDRPTRLQQR